MKYPILVLLLTFSFLGHTQDLSQSENKFLGYIYQQEAHQINDPKGDILLLWSAHQIPQFIKASIKGKATEVLKERQEQVDQLLLKYPEYKPVEEAKNLIDMNYATHNSDHLAIELEGHKAPFKVKNVVNMMKQVMSEEYQENKLEPKEGTVHTWSKETHKELKKKFKLFARMPKLLVALSRGATSQFMKTNTEDSLTDYILSRPRDSINIEEMFRASYKINQGDVYLTLLTIQNVLSRYWLVPNRDQREVTTRLKHITNFNYKTDKFGAWYHLFGIMLYGYAHGGLSSRIVGHLESMGSHIMDKFQKDERQEDIINRKGGPIGARLRKFVKKEEYKTFESNPALIEEDCYMDLDEDFSRRLEKALKKSAS